MLSTANAIECESQKISCIQRMAAYLKCMILRYTLVATMAAILVVGGISGDDHLDKKEIHQSKRAVRQTSADQMVQNILQWLQGVYTQQSRPIRQGSFREYLPPSNTQKPRPFEPVSPQDDNGINGNNGYINWGYPPAGSVTPQPPFPIYTNPATGAVTGEGYPTPSQPPFTGYPTGPTGYPTPGFPEHPNEKPTETQPPLSTAGYSSERPGYSTPSPPGGSTGYPYETPGYSTLPPLGPTTERPQFTTQQTTTTERTGYPFSTQPTIIPDKPGISTTSQPEVPIQTTQGLSTSVPALPTETFTSATTPEESPVGTTTTQSPEINTIPTDKPEKPATEAVEAEDEHPPHIHAIDVECAKEMMTINIEFNREFNGVIYSKGYYNMPECRYVKEKSGQTKYSFTVNLNQCGTEFINAFDTQGQSYLENVLVLQNEVGIQEIWDTVRAVRCLWEGNLKESLSVALSVGMLSQEIVTFSGDTAMAKLDVQLGRSPFGQSANGLVKIGEPMTLVVSVSGDPGFDIQVKDCKATDSTGENVVPLSDEDGCILKPKLFGAFQKSRDTENTGASIIAYAYFNAFKFPDVMDLMIECNIELCKTDCEMCPNPGQKLEPGRRRRRDLDSLNETLHDGVTMGKHLRVVLPEDFNERSVNDGVCMSVQNFVFSTTILISLLVVSFLFSAYMWMKTQRLYVNKK